MSDLTDLDICKKIAEIEDFEFVKSELSIVRVPTKKVTMNCFYHELNDKVKLAYNRLNPYNPLTDDGLITNLIFKYEVNVDHYSGVVYIDSDYTDMPPIAQVGFDDLEGMKKAICLAIIEANSNDKN